MVGGEGRGGYDTAVAIYTNDVASVSQGLFFLSVSLHVRSMLRSSSSHRSAG